MTGASNLFPEIACMLIEYNYTDLTNTVYIYVAGVFVVIKFLQLFLFVFVG